MPPGRKCPNLTDRPPSPAGFSRDSWQEFFEAEDDFDVHLIRTRSRQPPPPATSMARRGLLLLPVLLLAAGVPGARAHARLVCPAPWSAETGAKAGPCPGGVGPDAPVTTLQPGRNTVVWEESIYHFAAPTRLALAGPVSAAPTNLDAAAFDACVLLDQ